MDEPDNLKVPFLVGPTASGKTAVAIEVARLIGAEIISADARQIYRGMPIGTAQPTIAEQSRCHHHFIARLSPDESFSAGEFGRRARKKCLQLQGREIVPFVVGGSGLYLSALVDDFFEGPAADPGIRARLKAEAEAEGLEVLYQRLKSVDPKSIEKVMPNDFRRIERALEIFEITGRPISELHLLEGKPPPYLSVMLGLRWPREELYDRINHRCESMLEEGLIDEVRALIDGKDLDDPDFWRKNNALNSVGYVEVIQFLKGEIDEQEMLRLFQRNTRRFAKRQISWFGRDGRIKWIDMDSSKDSLSVADEILVILETEGFHERSNS